MSEITLNQHIGLAEVAAWPLRNDKLTIRLTRAASFDPGVEGIAIGFLRHVIHSGCVVHLKCAFNPLDEAGRPQGLLEGLLGTHLVFSASSIIVEGTGKGNIRSDLIKAIWHYIKLGEGQIGDGKKQSVIFRDPDYSVPDCLRDSSSARFPYPNKFRALLGGMTRRLSEFSELSTSLAEESIATFLYEAAFNAHEHARWDADNGTLPPAIRGITLEKLTFSSPDELHRRVSLSPTFRDYIARAWSGGARQITFLAATVADVGPGIQNTLPQVGGEDGWGRLNRAFRSGVTRKPVVPDKGLGEGLPNIAEAASRLRACLTVCSADLVGFRDFTIDRPVTDGGVLLRSDIELRKAHGTSLTIIWPIVSGRGSQGQLFPT